MTPEPNSSSNLLRTTVRTVAVLVGACVIFVGVLSAVAVFVTSRALSAGSAGSTEARSSESTPASQAAKKPLHI